MQKINQKLFRVEKVINRKGNNLQVKSKGYNKWLQAFNSWIDKKDIVKMSEYFPERKSSGGRVKVELDLSNYATKADLKNATGVDTSKSAKMVYLSNLKSDIDKLDTDKLKNVPSNLSNLKNKEDKVVSTCSCCFK